MKRAWETTKERAGDALHSGEQYVRKHPTTSVLSVFGTGCLVGIAIGWAIAHEAHESYSKRASDLLGILRGKLNLD